MNMKGCKVTTAHHTNKVMVTPSVGRRQTADSRIVQGSVRTKLSAWKAAPRKGPAALAPSPELYQRLEVPIDAPALDRYDLGS